MKRLFAFPFIENTRDNYGNVHPIQHGGMELRDYFAAKAMAANVVAYSQATGNSPSDVAIAEWSYHLADAMLEARSAKND